MSTFTYSDLAGIMDLPGPTKFADNYNGPIAVIGDVDGDDISDVLAGWTGGWSNPKTGGEFSGAAVFSGKTGEIIRVHTPDVRAFGWSVAALGDINGDGSPDYGIGTREIYGAPRVTVYDGISGAVMHNFTLGDTGQVEQQGALVAGPGDLDGDGRADILVGYPAQNQARIYSGRTGAVLHTFVGTDYGVTEQFGLAVAGGAGLNPESLNGADLTGTGGRDFLIVGPAAIFAFSGTSTDDVYSIPLATPIVSGEIPNLAITRGVLAGDADEVILLRNGTLNVHDGATGTVARTFTGTIELPFSGAFAVVGDLNGDGVRELAIASTSYSTSVTDGSFMFSPQGAVGIYSSADGTQLSLLTDFSALTVVSSGQGASAFNLGDHLAAADLNGDGLPELLASHEYNPDYGGPGARRLLQFDGSFLVNSPIIHGQGISPGTPREVLWGSLGTADFLYVNGRVIFIESLEGLSRGDRILSYGSSEDGIAMVVARQGDVSDSVLWVGNADYTRRGMVEMDVIVAGPAPAGEYAFSRVVATLTEAVYVERLRDGSTPTTWRVPFTEIGGLLVFGSQTYLFDGAPIAAASGTAQGVPEIVAATAGDDPNDALVQILGQEVVRIENFRPHAVMAQGVVVGLAQRDGDPEARPYAVTISGGSATALRALNVPAGGTGWARLGIAMDGTVTGEYTTAEGDLSIFINYFQALNGGSEAEVVDVRSSELAGAPDGFFARDPRLQSIFTAGGEFILQSVDPDTGLVRSAMLNDIAHFSGRRSGMGSTFVASADGLSIVTSSAAGEVIVFYREFFSGSPRWNYAVVTAGERLAAGEPRVDLHTGSMTTWSISGTNMPYVAIASPDGVILLEPTVYFQGGGSGPSFPFFAYNVRNLTQEITGSVAIAESLTTMLPQNGLRLLSGLTADGDLVLYGLNQSISTAVTSLQPIVTWSYANLYDQVLRPTGLAEPNFDVENNGDLVSYVTAWGGLNVAGISGGNVIAFWTAPGLDGWQVANITDAVTASDPDPTGLKNLQVYLTPWGGINLVGGDRLDVYWWAPALGGEWRHDILSQRAGHAVILQSDTLTTYVTPWGGLNVAGLDAQNQLWIYWWVPNEVQWKVESLDASLSAADQLVPRTGSLESSVSSTGEFSIFARTPFGDPIRYGWSPTQPWTVENLNFSADAG